MKTVERTSASALLLTLWALILLSTAVLAWAKWVQQDIELSGSANRNLEAKAMAHSGVAMALHPLVTQQSPQLEKEFGSQLGYRVRMISEGGKLNLTWLLAGEDPRKITILKLWLEQMGLGFQEREEFVDCVLDYIDPDDVKRLNGVEDEADYHPANRAILSVDELAQIRGTEPLTSKPGWKEQLTIYSQGPIDMLAAGFNVLRVLPGLGDARIQRFIAFRQGKDGLDGTADDPVFKSLREVQQFIGLNDTQFKELGGLVIAKDQTMNIIAEGRSGKVVRQLEVVARKGGANPTILHWKE